MLLRHFYRHSSNELAPVFLGVMTPGKSLAPWALVLEDKSYLPSGPYLGRITSKKRLGAQNEKRLKNYLKISK